MIAVSQDLTPVVDAQASTFPVDDAIDRPVMSAEAKRASDRFDIMQDLREEVRMLRGMVEELSYELQQVKQRQLDDYLDIDRRLGILNGGLPADNFVPDSSLKVSGESLAKEYGDNYGIDVRGIRYPGLISYKAPAGGGTTDYAVEIFSAAINHGYYECFVRPDTRLPMLYMDDAIKATLMLMDAQSDALGPSRAGYNIDCHSFTAKELADAISQEVDGFKCDFVPDVRQKYADSWPDSIDGSVAKKEWDWSPNYGLEEMVKAMLDGLSEEH